MGIIPAFDTGHIEADLQALTTKVDALRQVADGIEDYQTDTMVPLIQEVRADTESLQTDLDVIEGAVIAGTGQDRRTAIQALVTGTGALRHTVIEAVVDTVGGSQVDAISEILENQQDLADIKGSVGTGLAAAVAAVLSRVIAIQTSVGSGLAAAVASILNKVTAIGNRPLPRLAQDREQASAINITTAWTSGIQIVVPNQVGFNFEVRVKAYVTNSGASVVAMQMGRTASANDSPIFTSQQWATICEGTYGGHVANTGVWVRFRASATVALRAVNHQVIREGLGDAPILDEANGAEARELSAPTPVPTRWRYLLNWRKYIAWALWFVLGAFASWLCAAHGYCLLFPSPCS